MANFPSAIDLAELLPQAREIYVLRARYLAGRRVVLDLEVDRVEMTITVDVIEVLAGAYPEASPTTRKRARAQRSGGEVAGLKKRTGEVLSEEQARRVGAPLYHSRDWLERQYAQHGSWARIAQVFGYGENAVNDWARRHDLNVRPQYDPAWVQERVDELAAAMRGGEPLETLTAYAARVGVTKNKALRMYKRARALASESAPHLT